jgi:hypothetical protein
MPPVVSTMRIRQTSLLLVGLLPLLAVPAPLAAQTCVTSGADLKCSNAGSIAVIDAANNNDPGTTEAVNAGNIDQYLSAITNGNGVTVVSNSGRVGQGLYAATFGSGNGTTVATNSGSIAGDLTAETTGNGTTAVLNSGAIAQYLLASTNGDGATSVRNTGDIGGELRAEVLGNGTTTVVNSGPVGSNLSANTHGNGTTSVTNSGSVGSFIFANTGGNGNTTVTNSGRVADYVEVYVIADGNATLINTGSVGSYLSATVSNGSTTVVNSGTVGGGLYTAVFGGGDVSVSNSGSIGEDLTATTNNYGSVIVTNTGRIGWYLMAVNYGDGTTTVVNSGSIWRGAQVSTQGTGSSNLVNSGFITNTSGPLAIDMSGSNPTLTLLPGSIIIGGISLGGTNSAVAMNTGNQNLTFTSLAGVSVSGNVPFVVSGERIVSVDSTGFAMQGRALTDFTREVTASIPQTAAPAATGGGPLAFASSDAPSRIADAFAALPGPAASANDAIAFRNGTVIGADGSTMWGRSFAGQRIQPADGAMVRAQNLFYGGMIGGDTGAGSNLRLGGFFGMGTSRTSLDLNFGSSRSDTVFGGGYASYDAGPIFVRAVLQAGGSKNTSTRTVNNNLLGLEAASASFDGWYVSPDATIGQHVALGRLAGASYTLTPELRLRYLYGIYQGYTETGTTAPLTAGSRTVSVLEERGELKLRRTVTFGSDEQLSTSLHAGLLGTQRTGEGNIGTVLLGQSLPVISPGGRQAWAGFAGAGLDWQGRSFTLFSSAEYLAYSDGSSTVSGRGGFRIAF